MFAAYVIGVRRQLPPLDEPDLRDDEGDEQDEDHLGVHRLVAAVQLVHLHVLEPGR